MRTLGEEDLGAIISQQRGVIPNSEYHTNHHVI
jgi:hypothetical protein